MSATGTRVREIVAFLGVGAIAFVVQLVLLNALVSAGLDALPANAVATTISVSVAYVGNRHLSFGHRRHGDVHREAVAFVAVNIVTLGSSEALMALAYVGDGQHDRLLLNLLNLLGVASGTVLRYLAYRRWVFTGAGDQDRPHVISWKTYVTAVGTSVDMGIDDRSRSSPTRRRFMRYVPYWADAPD